jgi:hypothetical protein
MHSYISARKVNGKEKVDSKKALETWTKSKERKIV